MSTGPWTMGGTSSRILYPLPCRSETISEEGDLDEGAPPPFRLILTVPVDDLLETGNGINDPVLSVEHPAYFLSWQVDVYLQGKLPNNRRSLVALVVSCNNCQNKEKAWTCEVDYVVTLWKKDGKFCQKPKNRCVYQKELTADMDRGYMLATMRLSDLLHEYVNKDNGILVTIEAYPRTLLGIDGLVEYSREASTSKKYLNLLETGTAADVTFKLKNGVEIKGHKCILMERSSLFETTFEARTGEIQIQVKDVDEDTLRAFLKVLYSGDLRLIDEMDPKIVEKLIPVAHKYQQEGIRDHCIIVLGRSRCQPHTF